MGRQVLGGGECIDDREQIGESVTPVLDPVDADHEVGGRKPTGEPCRAAGRQRVVRAGAVVAQRHRCVTSDEDRSGRTDARRHCRRVSRLHLQVLRGEGVGGGHGLIEITDQERDATPGERCPHAVGVAGACDLGGERRVGPVDQGGIVGDQQAQRTRVVLGLRNEIAGEQARVGGLISDDRDLRRACLRVDAARAGGGDLHLCFGDVGVSGPDDLVAAWHGRRAVRHGCDRLRSADPQHPVGADDLGSGQDRLVDDTIHTRRCAQDHLVDTRDACRYDCHDDRRRIRAEAARHVHTDTAHRSMGQTEAGTVAVDVPVVGTSPLMEPPDLFGRTLEG